MKDRHWKHAFDSGFQEESQQPPREDLSQSQKNWVKRAWEWASVALLGFKSPAIPDAIPRYNERRGWFHIPAVRPELHHINPVGYSNRVTGEEYNVPENIAPVSSRLHVGRGVRRGDEDEDRVIHDDTMAAFRNHARGDKDSFKKMSKDRERLTKLGKGYHNEENDDYLRDLSQRVTDQYRETHPEDPFPKKISRKGRHRSR